MAGNRSIENVVFHKGATTISDGSTYVINSDGSTMNIDFVGTGTFQALIQGKVSSDSEWDDVMVVDLSTYNMTTTPDTFHTYQLETTAWSYIRIKLTSVTGNITVYGKLVG